MNQIRSTIHRSKSQLIDGIKVVSVMGLAFMGLVVTGPMSFALHSFDPLI